MVDSKYSGPLLVRDSELGGGGLLRITLADVPPTELADFAAKESHHSVAAVSAVHTPEGGLELQADLGSPSSRAWLGALSTDGPGCFGLQVDGSTFTEIIVLVVHPGTHFLAWGRWHSPMPAQRAGRGRVYGDEAIRVICPGPAGPSDPVDADQAPKQSAR
jgi:hypothetical protein